MSVPHDVAASEDVPRLPPFLTVQVEGRDLLLVRDAGGRVRATDLLCPHLGSPLTRGELDGESISCPRHFYAYDLGTGRNTFPGDERDLALGVHDVEERDGRVLVRLTAGA